MCDPVSALGAAAIGGGILMNQSAAGQVSDARAGVMSAENVRQQGFANQGHEIFSRTLPKFGVEEQTKGLAEAGDKRSASIQAGIKPSAPGMPVAGNAPSIVSDAVARATGGADRAGADYADRLGRAGGYGDLNFGNRVDIGRAGQESGVIGSMARGSAGVTPMELAAANEAGNNRKVIADLLSGVGQVGLMAGFSGVGPDSFSSLLKKPAVVSDTIPMGNLA